MKKTVLSFLCTFIFCATYSQGFYLHLNGNYSIALSGIVNTTNYYAQSTVSDNNMPIGNGLFPSFGEGYYFNKNFSLETNAFYQTGMERVTTTYYPEWENPPQPYPPFSSTQSYTSRALFLNQSFIFSFSYHKFAPYMLVGGIFTVLSTIQTIPYYRNTGLYAGINIGLGCDYFLSNHFALTTNIFINTILSRPLPYINDNQFGQPDNAIGLSIGIKFYINKHNL